MKIIKLLLVLVMISAITFSCKESKKDEVVEDTVEVAEEAAESSMEAVESNMESTDEAVEMDTEPKEESIETTTKGLDEAPIEGVIVETLADTPVVYPGCEGTVEEIRACSVKEFSNFLSKNFNSDIANDLNLEKGDHKIRSIIKIDDTGKASVIRVDAPNNEAALEKEIVRVIDKLPQMTPATKNGSPVNVSFILPVTFRIGD